jgi:hypothetical protein
LCLNIHQQDSQKVIILEFKLWKGSAVFMPGNQHLQGVGPKEQREYEHIKNAAEKSGRYGKRAKEVAARTVMKHHKEEGHKIGH